MLGRKIALAVESQDEAGVDDHSVGSDLFDRLGHGDPAILLLLGQSQELVIGRLDADENVTEIDFAHHLEELVVGRQIDGSLRDR
jgi:hypothetical protein